MAALTALAFDSVHGVKEATLCNHALYRLGGEVMKDHTEDSKISRVCRSVYAQTRDELLRNYPFGFAKKKTKISRDSAYAKPMGEYTYAYKVNDSYARTATWTLGAYQLTAVSVTPTTYNALTDDVIGRIVSGVGIQAGSRILARDTTTLTLDKPTTAAKTTEPITIKLAPLKITGIASSENLFDIVDSGDSQRILCNIITQAAGTADGTFDMLEISYIDQVVDPDLFDPIFRDALILRVASKIAVQITSTPQFVPQLQEEFAAIMNIAKQTAAQERITETSDPTWTSQAKA